MFLTVFIHYKCLLQWSEIMKNIFYSFEKKEEDDDSNEFIPTNEWQKVGDDQAIPPGLHVKMDLSNGGKWAKLMEKEDNKETALTEVIPENKSELTSDNDGVSSYKIEELKAALKKVKAEKIESKISQNKTAKFRSMEEIREAFEEFDLQEETDFQVMKRLVALIGNETVDAKTKLLALQDLEYYVHQIDNANDLVKFGGFDVVLRTLNSSDVTLKKEAAHVIGAAVQSNPKVQIEALRKGVLPTLLLLLSSSNQDLSLRKKSMFAISSLIRHFPLAQTHFFQYGGFQIMLDLFSQAGAETLQLKAIQLINDIMDERLTTEKDKEDPQREEKLKQYNRVDLGMIIKNLGWCRIFPPLLRHKQHTWRESVMEAMKAIFIHCEHTFQNHSIVRPLKELQIEYKRLLDDDVLKGETDSYYASLHQLSSDLLELTNSRLKDEM